MHSMRAHMDAMPYQHPFTCFLTDSSRIHARAPDTQPPHRAHLLPLLCPAGNDGGEAELAAVHTAADQIQDSCEGLMRHLLQLSSGVEGEEGGLRVAVAAWLRDAGQIEWLAPPMLSAGIFQPGFE